MEFMLNCYNNDENNPENSNCNASVRLFSDLWCAAAGVGSR